MFLGTPDVAAMVLQRLHDECAGSQSNWELVAVVSQPGRPRGRGRKTEGSPPPSPVSELAINLGIDKEKVMTPFTAREQDFLEELRRLEPDLCITAAYGNVLPDDFLSIPKYGTVNIHPSLLPRYRGAAPVQRAIEAGETESGVTVAYTVKAMDAGPIIAQERARVEENITAPEFLEQMFNLGSDLLVRNLPSILDGTAALHAQPQDASLVTVAKKITKEESILDFSSTARALHDKVRAFAGWPGAVAILSIYDLETDKKVTVQLKVEKTRVLDESAPPSGTPIFEVVGEYLKVTCVDGTSLQILEVKPPGKRSMTPAAWARGFKNKCQISSTQSE